MKSFLLFILVFRTCNLVLAQEDKIVLNVNNTVILNHELTYPEDILFIKAVVGSRLMLPNTEKLYILIASVGGELGELRRLVDFIDRMPNTAVICKYCYSSAAYLFANTKKPRYVIKKSELMMHEAFMDHVTVNFFTNEKSQLQDFINSSNEFDKGMYSLMKMSKEEYAKRIKNTQWTVRGDEIVKRHLADKTVSVSCDEEFKFLAPETCVP